MGFMFHFLEPDDLYYPNWVEMRRRTALLWLAFGVWGPVNLIVWGVVFDIVLGLSPMWVVVPTFIVQALLRSYQMSWPCPRCGDPFFSDAVWMYTNSLADSCVHCRLTRYAPHDDGADVPRRPRLAERSE